MNDEQPPRKARGRPRKVSVPMPELESKVQQAIKERQEAAHNANQGVCGPPIHVATESTVPKIDSVLQVTKGENRGRFCQVGRIDTDVFKCYINMSHGGKEIIDVRPGEYVLVSHTKPGMCARTNAIPDDDQKVPVPIDGTPFGGAR